MPKPKHIEAAEPPAETSGLSLPRNFAWMLAGNIGYGLCQWGMIIALAKLTNAHMIGQFALGLAIATPVLMFTNLQLRAVQAVDANKQYRFGEYFGLRTLTTPLGLAVIAAAACIAAQDDGTKLVILAVGAWKAVESLSDVFFGLFQQHNRLDQIGKSMLIKGTLSLLVLSVVLYLTRDVFWGVAGLLLPWLAVLIAFEVRRGRRFLPFPPTDSDSRIVSPSSWLAVRPRYHGERQWNLARAAFPLGIVMTLVSVNLNVPRYFVHFNAGEKMLGIFSAMAYVMVGVVTVADAMGHSATPRLSRFHAAGARSNFISMLLTLLGLAMLLGLAGVVAAWFAGQELLTLLYGAEYAPYSGVFVWLMAAAGISGMAALLTYGLTAARCFRFQVPIFAIATAANVVACGALVPRYGLKGAAIAAAASSLTQSVLAAGGLAYLLLNLPRADRESEAASGRRGCQAAGARAW